MGTVITPFLMHAYALLQVAHLRKLPSWPQGGFEPKRPGAATDAPQQRDAQGEEDGAAGAGGDEGGAVEGSESEDDDADLFVNNNRNHDGMASYTSKKGCV